MILISEKIASRFQFLSKQLIRMYGHLNDLSVEGCEDFGFRLLSNGDPVTEFGSLKPVAYKDLAGPYIITVAKFYSVGEKQ